VPRGREAVRHVGVEAKAGSAVSRNTSDDATSFTVPSPPQAITTSIPRATAACVRSRAWWRRSVTKISAATPCASTHAAACSARWRAVSGRTPSPEIGLMMTATRVGTRG
jgi:hypothetical protein